MAPAQKPRPNRYGLFGELSALWVLIRIAAQQRKVVRTLGVIECVLPDFRLANFECLSQRRFTGLQVARGVLKEPQTIQAVRGLFRIGRRSNGLLRDSNGFLEVALGIGILGL